MAILEDHLAKFHRMMDAKDIWDAIKSRFGGNDESKKMQKYILKQQFEGFTISNSKGLHKVYDRFQSLLIQLEVHGAGGIDDLSFDDLYNNMRVFESDIKGSNASSSSSPNVAFVSSESTNNTNEVSTANGVSSSLIHNNIKRETSSSYTNDLMYSLFVNQSSGPQLDHDDLEQINEYDLEEMDLKWHVVMISMRLKKFYKKTGRKLHFDTKEPVGFDKTKVECYNCHKTRHFARECRFKGSQDTRKRDRGSYGYKVKDNGRRAGKIEEPNALVTLDGEGIDWTAHANDEDEDFALMDFNNSSLYTEVMAISVISISSDSSVDSVGTPARRVILFGTIPTTIPDTTPVITPTATQTDTLGIPTETLIIPPTIPPSPDYTPASPDYSPASDSESDPSEDPSSDHIPPLLAVSPFLSLDDDPTDSDAPDTPSSPTYDTPFTDITASTQRSPIIPHRRVMLLAPG
ncbi:ribonuclease H-like domain-containing protein [Tanacetum coccineum]